MTPLQAELVDIVRATQKRAGVTQTVLCEEAGLGMKHVSEMLNGHCEGSLTAWQRLFDALTRLEAE